MSKSANDSEDNPMDQWDSAPPEMSRQTPAVVTPMKKKNFRVQTTKVHLTYKTHIDLEQFKDQILSKLPDTKMWSFVHENGDEDEADDDFENKTPYAHTHVFIWTKKNIDTINVHYFDLVPAPRQNIHPHCQGNKKSLDWARGIVMKYHHGHKTKKNGKKYFIEPVFLHQNGVAEWKMDEDVWEIAKNAPTWEDGCVELGMIPKSISDVKLVRKETKKRKLNPPKFPIESFNRSAMDLKLPLLILGDSDCGKTQYAKAHFKNPLLVSNMRDGAKNFIPDFHDGIVFDDVDFHDWYVTKVQHILDSDEPRTFDCKFGQYDIPANTKKIFTSNNPTIFHCKNYDELNEAQLHSIKRRYTLLEVHKDKPLYDCRKSCGP